MAVPLILWGAAAALGATGLVKGAKAVGNMSDAKDIGERAEFRHRRKLSELDNARDETNEKFEELGQLKLDIFSNQIFHIVNVLKQAKDTGSTLKDFESEFSLEDLNQMERMAIQSIEFEKGLLSGAAGGALAGLGAYGSVGLLASASTGTAISSLSGVAATNATLAWLGGGSLAAGGFGMTGGMIALGGIVAGPALAIGGFILASKAEEALTKAHQYDAEVDEAIAKMELVEVGLEGLRANAAEVIYTLIELVERFEKIKVDQITDPKLNEMLAVGKSIKELLDYKIMKEDGSPVANIKQVCSGHLTC